MIAACPTCNARYRIDTTKLRPEGARLRCSRCETVFRVRAPAAAGAPSPATQGPEEARPPSAAAREEVAPPSASAPTRAEVPTLPPVDAPRDSSRLVLVATPEPDAGKATATAIASWGLETLLVHDGVEAILNIQRALPRVVVLDAALPKMFGFQVCEILKRNESLRSIRVVLVGAIHDRDRYRRPPSELYGADVYVERHELPDALEALLRDFGLPLPAGVQAAAAAPQVPARPAPQVPPPPAPQRPAPTVEMTPPMPRSTVDQPEAAAPPPAPAAPSVDPALDEEVAKAERLARIIVSDIVLYNQAKFDAALRTGNVVEALASELEEGYSLFAQRVDPRVGAAQDYLSRELLRLARSRGMT